MKTFLLSLAALFIFSTASFAQYCGTSGPAMCTPSGILPPGQFTPNEDIPCVNRARFISSTSHFTSFDTVTAQGILITVNSLRIDSLNNLPAGLCWSTNLPNDSFSRSEPGCINISGITYAPPGQYKLSMIATVNLSLLGPTQVNASAMGLKIFLRVVDSTFSFCPPLDTSQTDSNSFIPYYNLNTNAAEVKGKLYFDANQNQAFDLGEQPVSNQLVSVGSYTALTNSNGNYYAYPVPGTHTIRPSLSGNLAAFSYSPDSLVVAADSGNSYLNNDFGVVIPASYCEGALAIVSTVPPPRPGFENGLRIHFRNIISGTPVSQNIRFTYDANQNFERAIPAPSSIDTATRTVTWVVSNLSSGSTWNADIIVRTPPTVAIGTVLTYTAFVGSSTCATTEVPQTAEESLVVGAFDPNDKTVSPVGAEPGGRVAPGTLLHYTVRFQNTGNYLAENVNVVDTMSPHLDLSTLKVLAASHSYEVIMQGRAVTFRFSQIMLPDSFSNEPMSHGYIKYSIMPNAGFTHHTVVRNRADIYFDFNEPVLTNTTVTTADNFIGIRKMAAPDLAFDVFPNPLTEGNWQLMTAPEAKGSEARIFTIEGRLIYSLPISGTRTEINAAQFAKGVYIIRIGNSASRIVKM